MTVVAALPTQPNKLLDKVYSFELQLFILLEDLRPANDQLIVGFYYHCLPVGWRFLAVDTVEQSHHRLFFHSSQNKLFGELLLLMLELLEFKVSCFEHISQSLQLRSHLLDELVEFSILTHHAIGAAPVLPQLVKLLAIFFAEIVQPILLGLELCDDSLMLSLLLT